MQIGISREKVTVTDTATEFGINGTVVKKSELAHLCECGPEDRCWAVPFSTLGWPEALRLCQHPDQQGHEKHDSEQHRFTQGQLTSIASLIVAARATQQE